MPNEKLPKMINVPERIWLQVGHALYEPDYIVDGEVDFNAIISEYTTWCQDEIEHGDVEYILASQVAAEIAEKDALWRFNAELLESAEKEVDQLSACLRDLMACYERRIRSGCTPEQLKQQPWRVAEYVAAEEALASRTADIKE